MKRILIPGGTGAMGVYLVPEMLKAGYKVDVISLDEKSSEDEWLTYYKANCLDSEVVGEFLKRDYDAVVDFMIYRSEDKLREFLPLYLENTGHYTFLSSYRVYADLEHPITEESPRLIDVSEDEGLLNSGDYSIYKARGEDLLRSLGKSNYTIVRPAITYSKYRFQLVTLEMDMLIRRMREGRTVYLPDTAMEKQATMSWAGDVAKMLARIVGNPDAMGNAYSVTTAEHLPWREVAEIYRDIGGLKYEVVSEDDYVSLLGGTVGARRQLIYDRCFDRIMDNSKILNLCGMKQSELMPLREGLRMELDALPKDHVFGQSPTYDRMNEYERMRKI